MLTKKVQLLSLLLVLGLSLSAQNFVAPAEAFSHKKTAYVTLTDGTTVTGLIKKVKREKGLIEEIKMELDNGKTEKISPKDIAYAYLPPSGLDKLTTTLDAATEMEQWDTRDLDADILSRGHGYFEQTEVHVERKTEVLLLQLMNPHFSSKVRVYNDPRAKETMSLGVAGIDVVGGLDKSYYFRVGDNIAYRIKKKDYDEEFARIFDGCDEVLSDEEAGVWNQLERHVRNYASSCAE